MGIGGPVKRRAVFLDRDGVINRATVMDGRPYPPQSLAEFEILPGVVEAVEALRKAGYVLVVVTNQPDVARGTASRAEVDGLNAYMQSVLKLDKVSTCFHDEADACHCRKPKPGLLQDAAKELDIDLRSSFMVGDRWRDVEAGQKAGCTTFFVDYGYAEKQPTGYDYRVQSLAQAAQHILSL